MAFRNLSVADLSRSVAFYEALDLEKNPRFRDDTAACIVISEAIFLVLLTPAKWAQFETRPVPDAHGICGLPVALSRDSRAGVDAITEAAVRAGGVEPKPATDLPSVSIRTARGPDGPTFAPSRMSMGEPTGERPDGRSRLAGAGSGNRPRPISVEGKCSR